MKFVSIASTKPDPEKSKASKERIANLKIQVREAKAAALQEIRDKKAEKREAKAAAKAKKEKAKAKATKKKAAKKSSKKSAKKAAKKAAKKK